MQEILEHQMDTEKLNSFKEAVLLARGFQHDYLNVMEALILSSKPTPDVKIRKAGQVNVAEKIAMQINKGKKE